MLKAIRFRGALRKCGGILALFVAVVIFSSWPTFVFMWTRSAKEKHLARIIEQSIAKQQIVAIEPLLPIASPVGPQPRNKRLILSWGTPWDLPWYQEGHVVGDCTITYNKYRIQEVGAVMFHYTALDQETMPWKHYRGSDQFFVFWSMDSPAYVKNEKNRDVTKFDNSFINWTMTYRLDSDIFSPFLQSTEAKRLFYSVGRTTVERLLNKKSKVALWLVNDCNRLNGSTERVKYVQGLIDAGLPVTKYGRCFGNQEEYSAHRPDELLSYKFSLAFENAKDCRYYVTEKFWRNAIHYGRVPVVWGTPKKDLVKIAPGSSFIHTEDFKSPTHLAEYLLYLDKNDTAYRKYFNWIGTPLMRDRIIAQLYQRTREEALCNKVMSNPPPKITESVTDFFFNSESNTCLA
ncbi:alpha-(1,3)-fucosyltransferase 7-like [Ciona intestinalis]